MSMRSTVVTLVATLVLAVPASAQAVRGQGQEKDDRSDTVPAAYRPPAGMCRVWVEKVPPPQQPAPTDCATAIRNRPANGRVLFGDDYAGNSARRETPKAGAALKGLLGGKEPVDWRKDRDKPKKP